MGAGKRGRDFVRAFAEEVIRRGLDVEFAFETRADSVETELFALLKQAGLYIVFLGIESGYQPTLDYFQKDITVAENRQAIEICEALVLTSVWAVSCFTSVPPWRRYERT